MKVFVKGLSALLICGTFAVANCDTVEAAKTTEAIGISESAIADFNIESLQIENLAFENHKAKRVYPPPPVPPPIPPPVPPRPPVATPQPVNPPKPYVPHPQGPPPAYNPPPPSGW